MKENLNIELNIDQAELRSKHKELEKAVEEEKKQAAEKEKTLLQKLKAKDNQQWARLMFLHLDEFA